MLLIFFLVTSSMDADKGLQRQLPPPPQAEQQAVDILDSDILTVSIDANDSVSIDGQPMTSPDELTQRVKRFAAERPEQRVVLVESRRESSYDAYFRVQDAIVRAYRQLKCPPRISETVIAEKGGQP